MATLDKPRVFYGLIDDLPVLGLKGQVRYMNAHGIRGFVDEFLVHASDVPMVIDLRELEAIDSTGLGLLAHLGRTSLERGHRAVIVCSVHDIMTCLRSVAFDTMFRILEEWPFPTEADMAEVRLDEHNPVPDIMGRFILEAHRDLAGLSEENRRSWADVISALEADLNDVRHPGVL
jgi:anti-anti-sigma factor